MKQLTTILLLLYITQAFAQKETFDIISYSPPFKWKKEQHAKGLQLSTSDEKKGTYAIILLFKSVESKATGKQNFDILWDSLVKSSVSISGDPQMMPAGSEDGWETVSGMAAYTDGEQQGVALQITATGHGKTANMILLTNTDAYQNDIDAFVQSLDLKKPIISNTTGAINNTAAVQHQPTGAGFTFTTTNFDDGWTSIVQGDWVETSKSNNKVLIHYPNKNADAYSSDLMQGLKNAWDVLVAPRYSSASNMAFKPLYSWQSIEFAEADMVEKATGKKVYVVFFKKNFSGGSGKYLEFVSPDKRTFENEFGAYTSEALSATWDKMAAMANYNKFAVAAADLRGKWTNSFSGMTQYVNAYTGADAGANTHAANENFAFGPGSTYSWDLGVASGFVGNIKFQSAKSSGRFSVPNNWEVNFSDIEGKPKTYKVQFTCIKGARILWIGETAFGKKD